MANDFSKDVTCKALWRFENGALTADSKGTNTLTPVNTPTANTTDYQEGAASTALVYTSHQFYKIADAALDAGFPLKNGDTTKQATFCFRVKPASYASNITPQTLIGYEGYHVGTIKFFVALAGTSTNNLIIYWGYNNGDNFYTYDTGIQLSKNAWWHIAIRIDGVNKVFNVRAWKYSDSSQKTYSASPGNVMNVEATEFRIGGTIQSDTAYSFDGLIDEVVVFNRVLTDAQIDKIRGQTYGPYDLTTSVATTSVASTPIAAITRPLSVSPASVSVVSSPILAITRALQTSEAVGSATSAPLLAVLRALSLSTSVVSATGTPVLAVERPLTSSLNVVSAVATPNLAVQRILASLAAVTGTTSDINLLLQAIWDLTTVIAVQSQASSPFLNVVRPLSSAAAGQTQVSTAVLAILRTLTAAVASETQTPDISLKVLRDLTTAISAQSAASTPALDLISLLTTAVQIVTGTVGAVAVLRKLATAIAAQTDVHDIDLAMGIPRDLITAIAAYTLTSEIEVILAFHESLLAKAKRYYGSTNPDALELAALQWANRERQKSENLPGDQYNDRL